MTHDPATSNPPTYPAPMPIRVSRQGVNVTQRQGLALSGAVLVLLAVPAGLVWPSIPLALPMAVIGTVLVGLNAVWARRWLDEKLGRYPQIERQVPDWLVRLVSGRPKRGAAN